MVGCAEEEESNIYEDVMHNLQLIPICLEFHKLPHEVEEEDEWTLDLLVTSLKARANKHKMEMERQKFLAQNRTR